MHSKDNSMHIYDNGEYINGEYNHNEKESHMSIHKPYHLNTPTATTTATASTTTSHKASSTSCVHQLRNEYFPRYTWQQQSIRSILQSINVFVRFFLMLVFMTLDVGLIMSITGGTGFGFFFFRRQITAHSTSSHSH